MKYTDRVKRTVAKTISYRGLILVSDGIIIYAITHRYDLAIGVIFFSNIASTLLFYVHERFWNKIGWGKGK